jgi:hypothetical protein
MSFSQLRDDNTFDIDRKLIADAYTNHKSVLKLIVHPSSLPIQLCQAFYPLILPLLQKLVWVLIDLDLPNALDMKKFHRT